MKILGAPLSPFVRKVVVYCAEREIAFELEPVTPFGPDGEREDFVAASPMRRIPAIDDDGYLLADSSAIIHYLEAKHGAALLPEEPKARGQAVFFDEIADTLIVGAFGAMFFNRVVAPKFLGQPGDLAAADLAERETAPLLMERLESIMPDGDYLVGDSLTVADIALASPFVNGKYAGYEVDPATHPKIAKWLAGIWARPSFAAQIALGENAIAAAG